MNKLSLLIIFLLLFTVSIVNGQEADKKVAVFDPVGEVSDNLKIIIREELSNAVVNTLGFTVLERELINKVLAENKFQMTGHVDDGQIGELGRKMGANYVCYASISFVGKNYYISCKMVDVQTAKIERQNTGMTESGLDDLFGVVSQVSRAMLQQQGSSSKNSASRNPKVNKTINLDDNNELIELNILGVNLIVMPNDITSMKVTWTEANQKCLESTAYGLDNWRLPSKLEISNMYAQRTQITGMKRYYYWSGTEEKKNVYWRQAFDAPKLVEASYKSKSHVRCVQSNGSDNILEEDGLFGIRIWGNDFHVMPDDIGAKHKWKNAIEACNNLSAFGYNDWVVPSIEELDELYNNRIALNMNGTWYWSSTPKKSGSTSFAYEKNFEDGKNYDTSSGSKRSVRCVRKK